MKNSKGHGNKWYAAGNGVYSPDHQRVAECFKRNGLSGSDVARMVAEDHNRERGLLIRMRRQSAALEMIVAMFDGLILPTRDALQQIETFAREALEDQRAGG